MTVRIIYNDNTYDIISAFALQRMIDSNKVKMFYRYSEKRWIALGVDPVRRIEKVYVYNGPERRLSGLVMS